MRQLVRAAVLLSIFFGPGYGQDAAEHFDLGGPCRDALQSNTFAQILAAKKNRSWDKLIELEKQSVREGCKIEYRWQELVTALLQANRPQEALQVMEEMDSRGFELNPSLLGAEHAEMKSFMESAIFRSSALGAKLRHLEEISDRRRVRFQEILKQLPASQKPAENYVARGVCPFECCRYGSWTVQEDTNLVASPGSKQVVGRALKGSRVVALTGEVHLTPLPVVVVGGGELPKDTIAFILDYAGEGYGHVYTKGKIVEAFLGYSEYCFHPSENCWGETLRPSNQRKEPVWWVKVKLPNGTTGWTDKPDHFGDKDGCG